MRRSLPAWLPLVLLAACSAWAAAPKPSTARVAASVARAPSRLIEPGIRLGPVRSESTLESLRAALGRRAVLADRVMAADGSRIPGAILYPRDPKKRIELAWRDTVTKRDPAWARVRGASTWWRTPAGVRLGTTLLELEKLNGRAFTLWSFGTSRPGRIRSWNEGALESELTEHGSVALELPAKAAPAQVNNLSQGSLLPSGDPTLRRLNPRVGEITITFETH